MNFTDMILVSIDDHVVEPADMFARHTPKKYAEYIPKLITSEQGVDQWVYRGKPVGVTGLNAVVGWPKEEWDKNPARYAEMRPGVYDIHRRIADMNANGILSSMCFPTFAGFSAGHLSQFKDEITIAVISAYNDWHIDEWCAAYPGRFIPNAILPLWEPALAVAEINRVAAKGFRGVTMPELPHIDGLPSYHDGEYWGPVWAALADTGLVMNLHIGQGFGALRLAPNAPIDNLMCLAPTVSQIAVQDLLWGPALRTYPGLKVALSEGGIGWIPFYLDRSDRHYTNQKWLRRDFGGRMPSDVFREHVMACYVTDRNSLKMRHEIGIDIIAWECDYPHSDSLFPDAPEFVLEELTSAGADDSDIHQITWQNACRFLNWDPFAHVSREQATVAALRESARDVDLTIRPRKEWAERYAAQHIS
ncbi:amidohydrolase family protein [Nocardia fluminea]|jgi:predicted TIM-barrel fold metal-dependent hydrolase|uniref:Putative TIM-barrel fold metal-dependent hydrolase n=1 Tax=Nocardia fluminea TaxID=134984 RepID=A0A2N3VKS9_9NOCA|nr:amidohydrolase family protein [Nocardia fluminea]PKV82229.1 putative TIM-barrel fold metal-dependent hydrolase [Nocardia fluminea]